MPFVAQMLINQCKHLTNIIIINIVCVVDANPINYVKIYWDLLQLTIKILLALSLFELEFWILSRGN